MLSFGPFLPPRLARRLCPSLAAFALVSMGCSDTTVSTHAALPPALSVNELVLGGDYQNVLKGMTVAIDTAENLAYVTGIMTTAVAVIDLSTHALVRTFSVTDIPLGVVRTTFDPNHRRLVIVSATSARILLIDPDSETLIAERNIAREDAGDGGNYPVVSIAVDPSRGTLYTARRDGGGRVSVYDAELRPLPELLRQREVVAVQWDTRSDALVALSSPRGDASSFLILPAGNETDMSAVMAPGGTDTLSKFRIGPEGDFFAVGSDLVRISRGGRLIFQTSLGGRPDGMEVSGEEIALLFRHGRRGDPGDYYARLARFSATTGQALPETEAGFESSHIAAHPDGGFVVGNAGDASVGVIGAGAGEMHFIDLGTAAEDICFVDDGRRVLILNRLGGSQLISYDLETEETVILGESTIGAWPIRMVADESRDRLYIWSHFESRVIVLRVSDLSPVGSIHSNIGHSLTDAMSDLAAARDVSLLAAVIPEHGVVSIMDVERDEATATIPIAEGRDSTGPGRMHAGVDGVRRRVFVYLSDNQRLYRLDESRGFEVDESVSVAVDAPPEAQASYAFQAVYVLEDQNRVAVWNQVYDADSLTLVGTTESVQRFVATSGNALYGERYESDGGLYLYRMDAGSLEETSLGLIDRYHAMGSYFAFDFERERFALAISAEARVGFFALSAEAAQ